ncbi:hypothetical protein P3H15_44825 [Rhodococcus sp. T2V]|nr:hypothetical protein [Rhodococcus sp. T2V]MDF3312100.1 hypothetical protein [Rhodococcus sp. T2V]
MTEPLYLDPVAAPVPGEAPPEKRLRRWPWIFGVVVALAAGVGT